MELREEEINWNGTGHSESSEQVTLLDFVIYRSGIGESHLPVNHNSSVNYPQWPQSAQIQAVTETYVSLHKKEARTEELLFSKPIAQELRSFCCEGYVGAPSLENPRNLEPCTPG